MQSCTNPVELSVVAKDHKILKMPRTTDLRALTLQQKAKKNLAIMNYLPL